MKSSLSSSHRLKALIYNHLWISIVIFLVIFFLGAVVIIYHFEGAENPSLTPFDAFRIVLVFFLGEYGDTPATEAGQFVSVITFVMGIVVVAAFIGKLAAVFVELKMEVKMPKHLERHIVMCNWHASGDRIIKELHSALAAPDTDIIVITEAEINEPELRQSAEYERVYFIKSDPTMHEVLKRARAHHAKSVIILADPACSDPDAKTALISLAITKLERELSEKPHIIAEVTSPHKVQHLVDAGVDEWVCSTDYSLGILAQAALYGKISDVYQQLLTYSAETNEIYLVDDDKYPRHFIGKSFQDVAQILNMQRNPKNPVILVGVKRGEQVVLNPREDEFDIFKPGDTLIVMSFDQPDLQTLLSAQH
jgi:voltage-gated potassium channel